MKKGIFDEVWRFGRKLLAFDVGSVAGREFYGFIEPMSFGSVVSETRDRMGVIPTEEYRLIAAPVETFPCGTETQIVCGNAKFELLAIKEVYDGEKISHRECVLLKVGEVTANA